MTDNLGGLYSRTAQGFAGYQGGQHPCPGCGYCPCCGRYSYNAFPINYPPAGLNGGWGFSGTTYPLALDTTPCGSQTGQNQ